MDTENLKSFAKEVKKEYMYKCDTVTSIDKEFGELLEDIIYSSNLFTKEKIEELRNFLKTIKIF